MLFILSKVLKSLFFEIISLILISSKIKELFLYKNFDISTNNQNSSSIFVENFNNSLFLSESFFINFSNNSNFQSFSFKYS